MNLSDIAIRRFAHQDADQVSSLFASVNRLLAPPEMHSAFETYIARALVEDIDRISEYYEEHGGAFWVAVWDREVVGMFGLEHASPFSFELRRMYVSPSARRCGLGSMMLRFAEEECRRSGRLEISLSTSELQAAAIRLYESAGYDCVRQEVATQVSNKTVGGGIRRYYFVKTLGRFSDD